MKFTPISHSSTTAASMAIPPAIALPAFMAEA